MDLVAGLREWKNAEIGEDKGKLITYMSSLEINDIYSLIKKKYCMWKTELFLQNTYKSGSCARILVYFWMHLFFWRRELHLNHGSIS